jgi:hypothetical protein
MYVSTGDGALFSAGPVGQRSKQSKADFKGRAIGSQNDRKGVSPLFVGGQPWCLDSTFKLLFLSLPFSF